MFFRPRTDPKVKIIDKRLTEAEIRVGLLEKRVAVIEREKPNDRLPRK